MKWTPTIAIALVPALATTLACSKSESHAAPPKTVSKLPDEPHPMTPPAPDANAASRKPVEPKAPLEKTPLEPKSTEPPSSPPLQLDAPPRTPPAESQPPAEEERLLSDEDAAIPTQEEADQEAALSITEENADQELEKLEKELAEGGGG